MDQSLNTVKTATLPKLIDSFNTTPIRISADFAEINKLIQKFMWKCKGPRIAKMILQKNNEVRGFTFPDFKTYYKAAVIKTMWYQPKDRHTDQWNGLKSLEINCYNYG